MNDGELLDFDNYLKEMEKEVDEELQPYYERYRDREKAGMNLYGVANYREEHLLRKSSRIYKLRKKIETSGSLAELEEKLKEEVETSNDQEQLLNLNIQLEYIDEYLKNKEKKELFDSSENTDDNQSRVSHIRK